MTERKKEEIKIKLTDEVFNLRDNIHALLAPYRSQANHKGLFFEVHTDSNVPKLLRGDINKINQLFKSLLDNTFRHTPEGWIKVNISGTINPEDEEEMILKISIADTGLDLGDTLENADNKELALANELVELMGGKIRVISHSNYQTEIGGPGNTIWFTIRLHVYKPDEIEGSLQDIKISTGVSYTIDANILVVDDNVAVQKFVEQLLKGFGCSLSFANDGREALDKDITEFDIILMDVQMPNLNGFEATKLIRSKGLKTPIIGITSDTSSEEIEECLDSGMDDFVGKSALREELPRKILKWSKEV